MFNTCLFKQGRNLYKALVKKISFVNMSANKNRFTVLNEDKNLTEEVKKFPCLYDKSSRLYRERDVLGNVWVETA